MAYESTTRAPTLDDFTTLTEHEAQTPGTFFGGKPILHLHCPAAVIRVVGNDLNALPELAAWHDGSESGSTDVVELSGIEVWVTSRYLTVFSQAKNNGIQIPYPTISIHAQDGGAVLLELNLSDENTLDEDLTFLQLRIVPGTITPTKIAQSQPNGASHNGSHEPSTDPVEALYDAISACQELNPDPLDDDDDDDDGDPEATFGLNDSTPGATGWITSENMHEFVDEHGNFRMPGANLTVIGDEDEAIDTDTTHNNSTSNTLGEGAGRRRLADEVDPVDRMNDETKWQRTG